MSEKIVIIDWGSAHRVIEGRANKQFTKDFIGTPIYMAPEVFMERPRFVKKKKKHCKNNPIFCLCFFTFFLFD